MLSSKVVQLSASTDKERTAPMGGRPRHRIWQPANALLNQSNDGFKTGSFLSRSFAFMPEHETVIERDPRGKS